MRVIAGTFRGRRLLGPKDATATRPITDRVKTSLFDRLWSRGLLPTDAHAAADEPVEQRGVVLDIFAGTGSLGLEALSRGVGRCVFVERERDALRRLKRNIDDLGVTDRAQVLAVDALTPTWLVHAVRRPARIAFVDPPYALIADAAGQRRLTPLLDTLARTLEPEGVMVLRLPRKIDPPAASGWRRPDEYEIGSMKLAFYSHAG